MFVADELRKCPFRHEVAGHDACVVVFVGDDVVSFLHERGDDTLGCLVPCAEQETRFFPKERGQPLFKFDVQIQRSCEIPGSGTSGAVFQHRLHGGVFYALIGSEAEIVVAPGHNDLPSLDHHYRAFILFDGPEIWIEPRSFNLICARE